jgi:hypothetical protein
MKIHINFLKSLNDSKTFLKEFEAYSKENTEIDEIIKYAVKFHVK